MPHAELKYSADLRIDAAEMLQAIEQIIQKHDAGSGDCKGRAYPASAALHDHLIVEVSMLPKPHRDPHFMAALRQDLFDALSARMPRPAWLSLNVTFSGDTYITEKLT